MSGYVSRPGVIYRATAGFVLLNIPLAITTMVTYWMAGGESAEWWVRGIVAIVVAIAEFGIVTTTIGPPLYEWIQGKEYVEDGKKPSWEK